MTHLLAQLRQHRVLMVGALLLIAFGGYYLFFQGEPVVVTAPRVIAVTKGTLTTTVSGSGQIEADSQVDLKPVAAGDAILVTSVSVKNDQAVKKGQLIATIDSEDALRDVRQAELSLKAVQIKMQQTAMDYQAKTQDETLVRRAQEVAVKQQELALQKSRSKLADYSIRAPFDGIVTGLDVDGGDTISQTSVLASVITTAMKAAIVLNEVDVVKIKVGDEVRLTFAALPDMVLLGTIAKLDTLGTASQGVVSYGAEVTLEEQPASLRPGMSVTADIIVQEKKDVIMVPNEALTYEGERVSVQVATAKKSAEGTATMTGQKRDVTVGITDNASTEIVSGLREGESVIVTRSTVVGTAQSPATQGNWLNSLLRGGRSSGGNGGSR